MKIQHHVPALGLRPDPITPEYQAEVDRATDKAMVAYERAQRRLRAAELRLDRANEAAHPASRKRAKAIQRERAVAAELVELRREELQRIEALMKTVPASAQHRGLESFRPVPTPGGTI